MQRMDWRDEARQQETRTEVRAEASANASAVYAFSCGEALLRAFKEHARQLGCSPDWLLAEALRRVIEEPVPQHATQEPRRERPTAPLPPPAAPPVRLRPRADARCIRLRAQTSEGTVRANASHGMIIGRSESEADLQLQHRGVSRKHVRIERRGEDWVVVDLASFNGVYVNAARTRCSPIVPGDTITIGPFTIFVEEA